jgi:hypothetical protein
MPPSGHAQVTVMWQFGEGLMMYCATDGAAMESQATIQKKTETEVSVHAIMIGKS